MADKTPSWVIKDNKAPLSPQTETDALIDTIGDWAGVATRALAPYGTAASLGAAAGAPFAGVGAVPGAAGGVLSLGLGDLATGGYNLIAPVFGGERVTIPSEAIQNAYERIGIGTRPKTAAQQVFSDVVQAGSGGLGQAQSAKALSNVMASPYAKNWMKFLGENARGQTGASALGAAVPSVAANYFNVENPLALTALSLAGGYAGGKAATPKVKMPTADELGARATASYKAAEQAGVRVSQPALAQLGSDVRTRLSGVQYDPGTQPQVRKWVGILDRNLKGPLSFEKLDALHSDIMAEARTVSNSRTRMMLQEIGATLDDFMFNLKPTQVNAGNVGAAATLVKDARQLWRSKSAIGLLDDAAETALNNSKQNKAPFAENIRAEYRKILRNKKTFDRLSPDVQATVKKVANGTISSRFLDKLGQLSPTNRKALWGEILLGATYAGTQHPASLLIPATVATVGGTSKAVANRMTAGQVQRARGAATKTPMPRGWSLLSPTAQQAAQAPEKGRTATRRRDTMEVPFWAVRPSQ